MTKLQTGVSYSKVRPSDPTGSLRFHEGHFQYMSLYTVAYNYCTSSKMHGSEGIGLGSKCLFFLERLTSMLTLLQPALA